MLTSLAKALLPQHGSILCYHGITGPGLASRPSFHVPAVQLAQDIALLQSMGQVVPLADLLARVDAGASTAGLFALTFDDAYVGVLTLALPVLRRAGAPASVFAVSGALTGDGRFWWDRIEDLLPHLAPDGWASLAASFGDSTNGAPPTLDAVRGHILARGHGRLSEGQALALASAEREAGFTTAMRSATESELLELAGDPLISIGPHTMTHAALATLGNDAVEAEIGGSVTALRNLGLSPLPVLAVPYGVGDDRTVSLARRAGMRWCLGVAPRTLAGAWATQPFPRFVMSVHRGGWRFRSQLLGMTDVAKRVLGRPEPDWPVLQRPSEA